MALKNYYNLKEKKKKNLMSAIAHCLVRNDYDSLSVNDIVKEADISRGSFYNYFNDKNDAVFTFVVSWFEIWKDTLKKAIVEADGKLFDGTLKNFDLVKSYLSDEVIASIIKNMKIYMGIISELVYSEEYCKKLDDLLDWLIENTEEGKTKLKTRESMANTLELIMALFINTVARMLTNKQSMKKYDNFNLKLGIIENGIKNLE